MPISKKIILLLGVVLVISYVFYFMFRTTDEIGFLGAGKVGRQMFIQTIDQGLKQGGKGSVDSEFFDRPFFVGLFLGEPLRTTIRFNFIEEKAQITNAEMVRNYLALQHKT